jgi:hypothetical protein
MLFNASPQKITIVLDRGLIRVSGFLMKYLILLLLTALLHGCATKTPPVNSKKDFRLVGDWVGERGAGSKCPYASWETTRDPEGSFVISFYSDPDRTQFTGREYGYWWTKGSLFHIVLPRIMKSSDSYRYSVEDDGSVASFREVSTDSGSACGENYRFRDVKTEF